MQLLEEAKFGALILINPNWKASSMPAQVLASAT